MINKQTELNNLEPETHSPVTNKISGNKLLLIVSILSGGFVISALLIAGSVIYVGRLWIANQTQPERVVNNEEVVIKDVQTPELAPFLGDKNAPVVVIEFADFQCPFCGIFHKETFPKFKTDYIDTGKAVFYYQDFAFLGDESQYLAEAGKCAQAQGKFWTFHDYIYENQKGENEGDYSIEKLKALAQPLGLDSAQYVQCVESRVYKPDVEAETQLGSSYGVQATPTFFVNGKKVEGAVDYSELKGILDTELNK